uniref:Uncharacterized protein n=1 Tax=Glossina brevipalpis TaxID=37001 RepID=A0A1A9WVK3_9MUSC
MCSIRIKFCNQYIGLTVFPYVFLKYLIIRIIVVVVVVAIVVVIIVTAAGIVRQVKLYLTGYETA